MIKSMLDKERIIHFFNAEEIGDDEYIRKVFCDNNVSDELEIILKKQWYESVGEDTLTEKNLNYILYRIHYNINNCSMKPEKPVLVFFKWVTRIAAVFLLSVVLYLGGQYFNNRNNDLAWIEIKAPAWTRAKFALPDSSIVWLNSNSSLQYRGDYFSERKVVLEGEAYFDVCTDKTNSFSVNAENLTISALGTKFNVASYDDENNLEIVLEEGELMVNDLKSDQSVAMVPDKLVIYNKERDQFTEEHVQTQAYVSWTEGKLVFRNDPLDVIARRLARWYNVEVEVRGNISNQPLLRATFIDENLEEVLRLLKLSLGIDYTIERPKIQPDSVYSKNKIVLISNNE